MGNCLQSKSEIGRSHTKSQANYKDLKATYNLDSNVLGAGSYGKVFLATNKKDASMKVAIKVIDKKEMNEDDIVSLNSEIELMQRVDHPNIVKYYETFHETRYSFLVMELCKVGGVLFSDL